MSKGSKHKGHTADARREERRRAQYESLQRAAAHAPAPPPTHREHIEGLDLKGREQYYYPLLHAIESALVAVYEERDELLVDEDAERAVRVVIMRVEGDAERRAGSPDADALADRVHGNLIALGDRFTPAEVVGALRRILDSIHTWHTLEDPRSYFEFISEYVPPVEWPDEDPAAMPAPGSPLWVPGQTRAAQEVRPAPRRPGGLIVPGEY